MKDIYLGITVFDGNAYKAMGTFNTVQAKGNFTGERGGSSYVP